MKEPLFVLLLNCFPQHVQETRKARGKRTYEKMNVSNTCNEFLFIALKENYFKTSSLF